MRWMVMAMAGCSILGSVSLGQEKAAPRSAKVALQAFNDLIGKWRGTGVPAGSREDQQKNFWTESISWQWQFKGRDAWLRADFTGGKHFKTGELRYLPDSAQFQLILHATGKEAKDKQIFTGKLEKRVLTLERSVAGGSQRLVISMLHANRYLYRLESKAAGKGLFSRQYQVGATKEGVAFAQGDGSPECIVSGGRGTIAVAYKGQTYYVCCSGCHDEFVANPEMYIREKKKKN